MEVKVMSIHLYTDGACTVGANGGWAVVSTTKKVLHYGGAESTTNNEMELFAVFDALSYCTENKDSDIHIYSDSQYTIGCMTQWASNWEKKGWKKKGGIKNLELIQEMYYLLKELEAMTSVTFHKVQGHSGNEFNDIADSLAVKGKELAISSDRKIISIYKIKERDILSF